MAQEDKLSIDKLDGAKNWKIWKYQMAAILEARELYGNVDGTRAVPSGLWLGEGSVNSKIWGPFHSAPPPSQKEGGNWRFFAKTKRPKNISKH